MKLFADHESSAILSLDGRYRYRLGRRWDDGPTVLFVMLNPSTADASSDDPTIRRCVGFARRWGYGALEVGNLFAFRATDPTELYRAADPVGPDNDGHLAEMAGGAHLVVAAWGVRGSYLGRSLDVRRLLGPAHILGRTAGGEPRHPLYLPATATPSSW